MSTGLEYIVVCTYNLMLPLFDIMKRRHSLRKLWLAHLILHVVYYEDRR